MSATARIANQMRLQAALVAGKLGAPRHGLVTSYDPDLYAVKVKIQPENVETGWLSIGTLMAGQGWGIYFGPTQGDQATILFQEGDREVGFCIGYMANEVDVPPHVESGEMHFIHKGGAFLKFLQDGKIHSHGEWQHDGLLHTTGAITSESDITDHTAADGSGSVSMKKHRDAYNAAQYPGVASGGAKTGTTDHPAT